MTHDSIAASALEQWRDLATQALKGADYEKVLVGCNNAGLRTDPLYTSADLPAQAILGVPGGPWELLQDLGSTEGEAWKSLALEAASNGQLLIDASPAGHEDLPWKSGLCPLGDKELAAFRNSLSGECRLLVEAHLDPAAGLKRLQTAGGGRLLADPWLGRALGSQVSPKDVYAALVPALGQEDLPGIFSSCGCGWHEAGVDAAGELALALASLDEALAATPPELRPHLLEGYAIQLSCDREFFTTIAKFRALRRLLDSLLEAWELKANVPLPLFARTSWRELSLADPWSNLLRTGSQAAAAACGGIAALSVHTFLDASGPWQNAQGPAASEHGLARRTARNTQHLLQREGCLGEVADPGGGSYYIESMSARLAEAAWERFREIHRKGGLAAILQQGLPAEWSRAQRRRELEELDRGRRVLVGVNRYSNLLEKLRMPLDGHRRLERGSLEFHRVAEPWEELRGPGEPLPLNVIRFGSTAATSARWDFVRQYLAAGGLQAEERACKKESLAGELDELAGQGDAPWLLCATDADLPDLLRQVRKAAGRERLLVLAANPKMLKADLPEDPALEWIHMGRPQLEILTSLRDALRKGEPHA